MQHVYAALCVFVKRNDGTLACCAESYFGEVRFGFVDIVIGLFRHILHGKLTSKLSQRELHILMLRKLSFFTLASFLISAPVARMRNKIKSLLTPRHARGDFIRHEPMATFLPYRFPDRLGYLLSRSNTPDERQRTKEGDR